MKKIIFILSIAFVGCVPALKAQDIYEPDSIKVKREVKLWKQVLKKDSLDIAKWDGKTDHYSIYTKKNKHKKYTVDSLQMSAWRKQSKTK